MLNFLNFEFNFDFDFDLQRFTELATRKQSSSPLVFGLTMAPGKSTITIGDVASVWIEIPSFALHHNLCKTSAYEVFNVTLSCAAAA